MNEDNYLDFGTPISFGWTAQYLDTKTCTRRQWKDSHAAKFCKAYDRAMLANKELRLPAIDKAYTAGGKQIGWCTLTIRPYKEQLNAMTYSDLMAEGGMCGSVCEFVEKYFEGDGNLEVWVINFRFTPLSGVEIQFVPTLERQFYADIHSVSSENALSPPIPVVNPVPVYEEGEDGEQIKTQIEYFRSLRRDGKSPTHLFDSANEGDRDLTIKRYLRLVNSPDYWERQPEDTPPPMQVDDLPPGLIVKGKRITAPVKKKILGALARSDIPKNQQLTVRQLFHQMKFFGYKYDYKLEVWNRK